MRIPPLPTPFSIAALPPGLGDPRHFALLPRGRGQPPLPPKRRVCTLNFTQKGHCSCAHSFESWIHSLTLASGPRAPCPASDLRPHTLGTAGPLAGLSATATKEMHRRGDAKVKADRVTAEAGGAGSDQTALLTALVPTPGMTGPPRPPRGPEPASDSQPSLGPPRGPARGPTDPMSSLRTEDPGPTSLPSWAHSPMGCRADRSKPAGTEPLPTGLVGTDTSTAPWEH